MSNPDNTSSQSSRRGPLRRGLTAAALVAGGIVIGAGGLAVAAGGGMGPGMMGSMGWHHHHRGVGMLQQRVRGALDNVGATTAQEDKVHDIIANASTELDKDRGDDKDRGGGMRRQIGELMKAPTLDRDAFEKLRAQKVAEMDAKSKVISNALFDAASQLTPEQRAKLVGDFEARADRGWFGHRRDGERGMERGREGGREGDMDRGPDGGRGPRGPE